MKKYIPEKLLSEELFKALDAEKFSELHDFINKRPDVLYGTGGFIKTLDKIDAINRISEHGRNFSSVFDRLVAHREVFDNFEFFRKIALGESSGFLTENPYLSFLSDFENARNISLLNEKIPVWNGLIEHQRTLGFSSHLYEALSGLDVDRNIFSGLILEGGQERLADIALALNSQSVLLGGLEYEENVGEEDESDICKNLILPEEFRARLEAVKFLPIKIFEKILKDPSFMHSMDPLDFEKLVAELLDKSGFENIIITPRSDDKGRDILATNRVCEIPMLFAFECKRYAPNRKIGPHIMRALLGTITHANTKANKGVLVTTSSFTQGSKSLIAGESMLGGKDFNDLVAWISKVKQ